MEGSFSHAVSYGVTQRYKIIKNLGSGGFGDTFRANTIFAKSRHLLFYGK